MKYPPLHYHDYLNLDHLLNAQKRRSEELGMPAHDEYLFITVHQVYELWFKQMLIELDAVMETFSNTPVSEQKMLQAYSRLERIVMIMKHSLGQIDIMETMTPLDFLDFRDFLYPASGFQSYQFRLLETKLGLRLGDRLQYSQSPFYKHLSKDQQTKMEQILQEPSLLDRVESWLMRTPFVKNQSYDFWKEYQKAVVQLFEEDKQIVKMNPRLDEEQRKKSLEMIDGSLKTFQALFDKQSFEELLNKGFFRLRYEAVHAALFIQIYRDEPVLQVPFKIINALCDLDEILTQWRYRHSLMALRMLGRKIGTGGSSGHDYLKSTADQHKIFGDFFNLTTFLIPRSKIPPLPKELSDKMGFSY
jgi:tryptophan 2,3-dioxygenase